MRTDWDPEAGQGGFGRRFRPNVAVIHVIGLRPGSHTARVDFVDHYVARMLALPCRLRDGRVEEKSATCACQVRAVGLAKGIRMLARAGIEVEDPDLEDVARLGAADFDRTRQNVPAGALGKDALDVGIVHPHPLVLVGVVADQLDGEEVAALRGQDRRKLATENSLLRRVDGAGQVVVHRSARIAIGIRRGCRGDQRADSGAPEDRPAHN